MFFKHALVRSGVLAQAKLLWLLSVLVKFCTYIHLLKIFEVTDDST
jgi:hypothetical protein